MIKKIKIVIIFYIAIFLLQCCEGERLIGKLKVKGIDGIYFRLYQYDEFDHSTPLMCDLVDEKDSLIARKHFITGTHDYVDDLEDFTTGYYDSIVYLTYIDSQVIYAVYDLKSRWGYPQGIYGDDYKDKFRKADSLIAELQKYNPVLRPRYKE